MASSSRAPTGWRITCARSGSAPRRVVGLCVERSLEMVVGAARHPQGGRRLLPLDPGLPARRGSPSCWRMPRAPVLVTQAALRERLRRRRRTASCGSMPTAAHRPAARAPRRQRAATRTTRLRDLHLGLDRHAERGGRHHGGIPNLAEAQIDRGASPLPRARPAVRLDRASMPRSGTSGGLASGAALVLAAGGAHAASGWRRLITRAEGHPCDAAAVGAGRPAGRTLR